MIEDKDRLLMAIHSFLKELDTCKTFEKGAGGMSVEAQMHRTYLVGVRQSWVEDFRETVNQIVHVE